MATSIKTEAADLMFGLTEEEKLHMQYNPPLPPPPSFQEPMTKQPMDNRLKMEVREEPTSPSGSPGSSTSEDPTQNVTGLDKLNRRLDFLEQALYALSQGFQDADRIANQNPLPYPQPQALATNPFLSQPPPTNPAPQSIPHTIPKTAPPPQQPVPIPVTPVQQVTPHVEPRYMKPESVPILELDKLGDLSSVARLSHFIRQVEQTAGSDEQRMNIAQCRADADIATMINMEREQGKVKTWDDLVKYLKQTYAPPLPITTALQQLSLEPYDITENPRTYSNRLAARYATLPKNLIAELESKDKFIKKKMHSTLPSMVKEHMEPLISENTSLDRYLGILEIQRQLELASRKSNNLTVLEVKPQRTPVTSSPPINTPPVSLEKRMDKLITTVETLSQRGPYRSKYGQWCGYCRTNDHFPSTCPHNPTPGSCFDCFRMGHKRRDPACPGRVSNTTA